MSLVEKTHLKAFVVFGCVIFLLAGCSRVEREWDDYLARMSRVLNEDIPSIESFGLPAFPENVQLRLEVPETRISVLQAWQLHHCELFRLIGERNSVLGRLSEPEIRWLYEFQLQKLLADCIADSRTEAEVQTLLVSISRQKAMEYSQVVWNATFASPSFNQIFSLSERAIPFVKVPDYGAYQTGMEYLSAWDSEHFQLEEAELLSVGKLHESFALFGSALLSMRIAEVNLQRANAMLSNAIETQYLCPNGLTRPELDRARNVLVNKFVQELQPWLVTVTRSYDAVFYPSRQLLETFRPEQTLLPVLARVENYLAVADETKSQLLDTLKLHTELWQRLFQVCNASVVEG